VAVSNVIWLYGNVAQIRLKIVQKPVNLDSSEAIFDIGSSLLSEAFLSCLTITAKSSCFCTYQ